MTFGDTLVSFRERYGVSRRRLHELTGLSLSYLHYIENNRVLPGHDNLEKIAAGISEHTGTRISSVELVRERDEIELHRLGLGQNEAGLALFFKEHGPVSNEARRKIEESARQALDVDEQPREPA